MWVTMKLSPYIQEVCKEIYIKFTNGMLENKLMYFYKAFQWVINASTTYAK